MVFEGFLIHSARLDIPTGRLPLPKLNPFLGKVCSGITDPQCGSPSLKNPIALSFLSDLTVC